jgi:hypothetical protein
MAMIQNLISSKESTNILKILDHDLNSAMGVSKDSGSL